MRTDKLTEAFRALCAARKNHPDVLFCEFTEKKWPLSSPFISVL